MKELVKKQTTIYSDSQATMTVLAASRIKPLFIVDGIEKLISLSEENQVTIMWIRGHSGTEQNETVDRIGKEGVRTIPMYLKLFLTLSCDRCKSKIRNCTERRKQINEKPMKCMEPANYVWKDRSIGTMFGYE